MTAEYDNNPTEFLTDAADTVSAMPPPMIVANAYSEEAYAPSPPKAPRLSTRAVTALGIAATLVAVAVAGAAAVGVLRQPSTPIPPAPVVATSTVLPRPLRTVTVTQTPPPTVTVTAAPIPTVTVSPTPAPLSIDAHKQLRSQADVDSPSVTAWAKGQWFPQLSSKTLGTTDGGVTYDYDLIWSEHLALRSSYGAVLLYSGDWPASFRRPDYWVTVAWFVFPDAAGARGWCVDHGLDSDHCFPVQLR